MLFAGLKSQIEEMRETWEEIQRLAEIIKVHHSNRFRVQLAAIKILHLHGNHRACVPATCNEVSDEEATAEEADGSR